MKIYHTKSFVYCFVLFSMLFPSCMHTLMMSGQNNHEGMESNTYTKEVTGNDVVLTITIPPMIVRKESAITITMRSTKTLPDSIPLVYTITHSGGTVSPSEHSHDEMEDQEHFAPIRENIFLKNGALSVPFTPTAMGHYAMTVETTFDTTPIRSELRFTAHKKKESGFMGMSGMWEYPLLGIAVMGAMMLAMWGIRGS